jgi:hypothetical protein
MTNKTAGFSLLEVLASLLVTMLLIMGLTPLVGQMLATWARGSEVAGLVEFKIRGVGILRDDLRHTIVWTGFGKTDKLLVFRGNETSMSFPAISQHGQGPTQLEMISIAVAHTFDGHALIRRRAPVVGTTYTAFSDPVVLFSGPYKYFLRYYSRDGQEKSEWIDSLSPPARIVLNITDSRGHVAGIPVQIPIIASASSACLLSANLPGCPGLPSPPDDNPVLKSFIAALGR